MNTKRGRKAIKPSIKNLIFAKALKDKGMPRLALAIELRNLIEEMGEIPPTEETIMRLISKARNHPASPLDEPWSIGTLAEYDITPEAFPKIVEIQNLRRNVEKPLTIREAKWVGRLYTLSSNLTELDALSTYYSMREISSEISGIPCDTLSVDNFVLEAPIAAALILLSTVYPISPGEDMVKDVYKMEDMLDLQLERPDFTGTAFTTYGSLLASYIEKGIYKNLSKEELKQDVLKIREMAKNAWSDKTNSIKEH